MNMHLPTNCQKFNLYGIMQSQQQGTSIEDSWSDAPLSVLKRQKEWQLHEQLVLTKLMLILSSQLIPKLLRKHSFTPDRVFNINETGLITVTKPGKGKVFCEKGKPSQISRELGTTMVFVGIISVSGTFILPVFIIPRKIWDVTFMRGAIDDSKGILNQSGWESFLETVKHI